MTADEQGPQATTPYGQGQPPYGQQYPAPQYGQPPYPAPQYGQPQYPAPQYPAPQYPAPQYPAPQYPAPQCGQPPYPQPYGQQPYPTPGWVPPTQTWPHGPGRPGLATAAAVLGFVAGGLTVLVSIGMLVSVLTGDGDAPTAVLIAGLPCAAGLITGGVWLMQRRSAQLLTWSAVAAAVVLVVALLVGTATEDEDTVVGLLMFTLVALVMPVLIAVFSVRRTVADWLAAR